MSGHSKWHSIRHKKAAADAKRGNIFTKLGRNITVAAKELGGDLDTNFKLRLAVEKARAANMPKDNIERAIKRGTGELAGDIIQEIVYEGFGPDGVAMMVEALTDNTNRSYSNIKTIFSKKGGNLGAAGSVGWMFERKGVFVISADQFEGKDSDEVELFLIEAGADDIDFSEEAKLYRIECAMEEFKNVEQNLSSEKVAIQEGALEYVPKESVEISEKTQKALDNLIEALDEDDDVSQVYTNIA